MLHIEVVLLNHTTAYAGMYLSSEFNTVVLVQPS